VLFLVCDGLIGSLLKIMLTSLTQKSKVVAYFMCCQLTTHELIYTMLSCQLILCVPQKNKPYVLSTCLGSTVVCLYPRQNKVLTPASTITSTTTHTHTPLNLFLLHAPTSFKLFTKSVILSSNPLNSIPKTSFDLLLSKLYTPPSG